MNSLLQGRPTLKNALLQHTSTRKLPPYYVFSTQIMPQIQSKRSLVIVRVPFLYVPVPISRAMKRLNQKLK